MAQPCRMLLMACILLAFCSISPVILIDKLKNKSDFLLSISCKELPEKSNLFSKISQLVTSKKKLEVAPGGTIQLQWLLGTLSNQTPKEERKQTNEKNKKEYKRVEGELFHITFGTDLDYKEYIVQLITEQSEKLRIFEVCNKQPFLLKTLDISNIFSVQKVLNETPFVSVSLKIASDGALELIMGDKTERVIAEKQKKLESNLSDVWYKRQQKRKKDLVTRSQTLVPTPRRLTPISHQNNSYENPLQKLGSEEKFSTTTTIGSSLPQTPKKQAHAKLRAEIRKKRLGNTPDKSK